MHDCESSYQYSSLRLADRNTCYAYNSRSTCSNNESMLCSEGLAVGRLDDTVYIIVR